MNAVHVVPLHDTIDHEVPGGLDRVLPDAVGDRGGDLDVRWIGVPEGFDRDRHVAARPERQKVLTSGRKFRFVLRLRVFEQAGDEQQQKIRAALSDTVSV